MSVEAWLPFCFYFCCLQTSGLKVFESVKSAASSAPEEDDDELEALRSAALLSMKAKTKATSGSPNLSEVRDRPGIYPNYSRYQHAKRTPALGKQYPRGQHTRSNLIVIQPVPLDGSEPRRNPSETCHNSGAFRAIEPPRLSLPQDRWCPQLKEGTPAPQKSDTSKRKVSGKFSHFESSSESEESDDDDGLLRSGSTSSSSAISLDDDSCGELNTDSNAPADEEDTVDRFDTNSNSQCASQSPICSQDRADIRSTESEAVSNENDANRHLEAPSSPAPTDNSRLQTPLEDRSPGLTISEKCGVESVHRDDRPGESEGRTDVSALSRCSQTTPEICRQENASRIEADDKRDEDESPPKSRGCGTDNGVSLTTECGAHRREVERRVNVVAESVAQAERRATPISWEKRAEGDKHEASRVPVEGNGPPPSASNLLEARRRKFELNAPVCPTGGKIVLLKGPKCTDQTAQLENPPPPPLHEARSRSRSGSVSPPLLRSVLSVVKVTSREPSPLSQPAAVAERKRHRRAGGGRTVEVIMPDIGDESSDAGEITASSAKLPVHLRLGEAPSAVCTSKKKKSKRKRSSRDLPGGAKRKRTKASLDHGPRQREQRWRRKVCSLRPSSP